MPTSSATVLAVGSLSPVSRIGAGRAPAAARSLRGSSASPGRRRRRAPAPAPSQPAATAVLPSASASRRASASASAELRGPTRRAARAADDQRVAVDHALDAQTLCVLEALDGESGAIGAAAAAIARRDRMLGRVLQRADEAQAPLVGRRPARDTSDERHLPRRDRSRLVEQDRVDRRVDSSTSGPLIRMPSCAPRPVPTSRAVGVASPSAHGQAMISTATAAENANAAPAPAPSQKPSVATAIAITIGTKTPETRSARRCTGALPDWASVTSRAICASAVSAPTAVARTMRRPPTLTVAPTTSSPGADLDRHALPRQQRPVDCGAALLDDAVRRTFSPGTNDEPVADLKLARSATRRSTPSVVEDVRLLRAELQQRLERGAGAALGPRLEVAAGEDEDGHDRGDLEVDLAREPSPRPTTSSNGIRMPGSPASRKKSATTDQPQAASVPTEIRVSIVAAPWLQVLPGRLMERPAAPEHDGRRELQREPLPVVELQRLDHRQQQHRQREHAPRRSGADAAARSDRRPPPRARRSRACAW